MNTQQADDVIAEAKKLLTGITPGEWRHYDGQLRPNFPTRIFEVQAGDMSVIRWGGFDGVDYPNKQIAANVRFIAAAPRLIAALLERVTRHEQELQEARKDAVYHSDCRPNRRQAEKAMADAKALNDWRADVTAATIAACGLEGGLFYDDVPKRIRELGAASVSSQQEPPKELKPQFVEVFPCVCGEPIIMPHVRCQTCICKQRDELQNEVDRLRRAAEGRPPEQEQL